MVVLTGVKFVLVLIQRPTVWSALVSAFHPPLSRLLPHKNGKKTVISPNATSCVLTCLAGTAPLSSLPCS